jgi:hypothetical protein
MEHCLKGNLQRKLAAVLALWGMVCGTAGAIGNMADITVHDRAENRALPVYQHEGRYYVVGRPGNEYQIRVRNRTGTDILSVVSVDGVNAVSGETADWNQTGYVLGPQQSFDIRGWRKSLQRIAAFYFTEHQQSYAARTGRPDNVGVIGVAVYRRKTEPQAYLPRPPYGAPRRQAAEAESGAGASMDRAERGVDSAERRADSAARSAGSAATQPYAPSPVEKSTALGTGHGRSIASSVTYTDFERATATPEEVIAIHYDTHANLVAMGVIRAPRIAAPTPFPGQFVPDPR